MLALPQLAGAVCGGRERSCRLGRRRFGRGPLLGFVGNREFPPQRSVSVGGGPTGYEFQSGWGRFRCPARYRRRTTGLRRMDSCVSTHQSKRPRSRSGLPSPHLTLEPEAGRWERKDRGLPPWCSPPVSRYLVSHQAISAVTEGSSTPARLLPPCHRRPIRSSLSIPMQCRMPILTKAMLPMATTMSVH